MNPDAFRSHVRDFFTRTTPAVLGGDRSALRKAKAWRAALFDAGLAGSGYPSKYCGHDHPAEFAAIYAEESRTRVPREDAAFGIGVVGDVNGGWTTAVALLAHERKLTGVASMQNDQDQRSKSGRVPIPARQLIELASERNTPFRDLPKN